MRSIALRAVIVAALGWTVAATSGRPQPADPPAKPIGPLAAIFDAFQSHELVSISSHHGNEQVNAFELALIRDRRFLGTVNDIVAEFGNARYQDLVDRFV